MRRLLLLLPLALLTLLVVLPLVRLFMQGTSAWSFGFLSDSYYRWHIEWTMIQSLVTCALALVFGLPVAWVLASYEFGGRALFARLLLLPFVMPTLVAAIGVLALFGPSGVLHLNLQDTPWLLLYGNLFFNLPLLILAAQDGFERVPATRLAAARTLGASPWRVFWRVELPGAWPWLCSALCLIFLYCFSGFGLALLLGGQHYATVEVEIYTLVAYEMDLSDAGALALVVLGLTASCALLYAWQERRQSAPARGVARTRTRPQGWRQWGLLAGAAVIVSAFAFAPLLAIVLRAVEAGASTWGSLLAPDTLGALKNTARFTSMALGAATLCGLAHAFAARRNVWLRSLSFLPYAVSPICVAFGLLLMYPDISATLVILVGAYTLLAYPFVARNVSSALDVIEPHVLDAARSLGASSWRSMLRVELPLVLPALRRGMAFAAATALGEFAVTLFLSRPEWTTLTTLIYQRLGRPGADNQAQAMVLSCVLMLLALTAFVVIEWPMPKGVRHAGAD